MPPDIYRLKSIVLVPVDIISWDFIDVKNKIDTKCIDNKFESGRIAILIKWHRIPALVGGLDIRQPQILFDTCYKVLSYRGHPMNSFADRFVETP